MDKIEGADRFTDTISFDDVYFNGIQGYNKLMLSAEFYQSFDEYEFILIHQLDAFVLRDELLTWCSRKYDYIGAPWLKRLANPDFVKEWKTRLNTRYNIFFNTLEDGVPSDRQFDNMVGNGGFSLRRVKKFYNLAISFKEKINEYNQREEHQFHEDVFWSVEVNRKWPRLKIPLYKTALKFSFENRLTQSMFHTKNQLPFGCHAWDQHLWFWGPYLAELGYELPESDH
ncbi:DUF5672 family protein [Dyadobacter sp. CY312]|uniref:DUF5672 family protein n=1 Tax=Dyadobacter sp. CY312 TaxID=2907303 RepID=UPI001F2D6AB2|nr:DUF5672 family protein [Dyadobacter sp. CY312]MCE7038817.1 hypothetical protein [Dyadobacter sp. CY312]